MTLLRQQLLFSRATNVAALYPAGAAPPAGDYCSNAVNFDGSAAYLRRGGAITGLSDSKVGTVSVWLKSGTDATDFIVTGSNPDRVRVWKNTSKELRIRLKNAAGTNIAVYATATNSFQVADGWVHFLASWNLATPVFHLYLNDDNSGTQTITAAVDDTIDYTTTDWDVGAFDGGSLFNGDMADFYFTDEYIDLSAESNRRKFIDASLLPVDLGSDGSTPTGTAARLFFSGATETWHTNDGTGGGFTENGVLTGAANPSGCADRQSAVAGLYIIETGSRESAVAGVYINDTAGS